MAKVVAFVVVGTVVLALPLGAAIQWLRLEALGLPGHAALTGLPLAVLWRTGLESLLAFTLAGVAVGLAVRLAASRNWSHLPGWRLAAAGAMVLGALIGVGQAAVTPHLPIVSATLADGEGRVSGFEVGKTSNRLYVAAAPSDDPRDALASTGPMRLLAISRDDIRTVARRGGARLRPGWGAPTGAVASGQARHAAAPAREVTTPDPAATFAPAVSLHPQERALPIGAETFVAHSRLVWAKDDFCAHEPIAWGRLLRRRARRGRASTLSTDRLGHPRRTYRNVQATTDCGDASSRPIAATEHTRPWDIRRSPGLGIKEGFYLDLADVARQTAPRSPGRQRRVRAPAYWTMSRGVTANAPSRRITYWLLFPTDMPAVPERMRGHFHREGDWERISVLLHEGARPDAYVPVSVRYHYYDRHRDVPWRKARRVSGGSGDRTHPVVYGALRSHTPFWQPGRYELVIEHSTWDADPDRPHIRERAASCRGCARWRTWERLLAARRQPWYRYGGAWGEVIAGGSSSNSGPLGPSPFRRAGLASDGARSVGTSPPRRVLPSTVESLADAGQLRQPAGRQPWR